MPLTRNRRDVLGVVLTYAAVGALWIGCTDFLVNVLFSDPTWRWIANAVKGWAFVVVTALLLWFLLTRMLLRHDLVVEQDRTQAELLLSRSEQQYRMSFDANPLPMWLFDVESLRFLAVNDAAVRAYGYSTAEFLSMTIADIRPKEDAARLSAHLADLGSSVQTELRYSGAWHHRRKSGEVFEVDVITSDLALDGRVARLVQARDITQEVQAEQALRRSQQALSELTHRLLKQEQEATRRIAQALHDQLGQTLVVSKLLVDAAAADVQEGLPKSTLERAGSQLDAATKWVRQMLVELRPPLLEDKGLVAAIQSEVNLLQGAAGGASMTVEADKASSALRWPSEVEYAVFMIVRESLCNAMQHAKASCIRIRVVGQAQVLRVDVMDDGIGLSQESAVGRPGHLGLVGMRERATQLGAELTMGASPSGGTQVTLTWRKEA